MLSTHGYFLGMLWEGSHRRAAGPVSLSDYRYIRRHTGGVPTWLMLIEIYGGTRPCPRDLGHPQARALADRIGDVLTWQNDLLSYDAEVASGVPVLSLPTVLRWEYGLPTAHAAAVAAEMLHVELAAYRAAERAVLRWAGPALTAYVRQLRDLVSGSLAWHLETGRYS